MPGEQSFERWIVDRILKGLRCSEEFAPVESSSCKENGKEIGGRLLLVGKDS